MKMAMIKQFDEADELINVTLHYHINKKSDKSINQCQHNHFFYFVDDLNINSALKLTVGKKLPKRYTSKTMN